MKKNLRNLESTAKPGVKAAPQNVHTSGLEEISKSLAVAAFGAQQAGTARQKSETDFLKEIVGELEGIKKNVEGKDIKSIINEELKTYGDRALGFVNDAANSAKEWFFNKALPKLGNAIADAAKGTGKALAKSAVGAPLAALALLTGGSGSGGDEGGDGGGS
jgi:hypothetical protein